MYTKLYLETILRGENACEEKSMGNDRFFSWDEEEVRA